NLGLPRRGRHVCRLQHDHHVERRGLGGQVSHSENKAHREGQIVRCAALEGEKRTPAATWRASPTALRCLPRITQNPEMTANVIGSLWRQRRVDGTFWIYQSLSRQAWCRERGRTRRSATGRRQSFGKYQAHRRPREKLFGYYERWRDVQKYTAQVRALSVRASTLTPKLRGLSGRGQ